MKTPRSTPQDAMETCRRGSARWRLLKAAIEEFAEQGYAGAGIRRIAQRAGVNTALVSFHFGGKAGLFQATLRLAGRTNRKRLESLPAIPDAAEAFADLKAAKALRALLDTVLEMGFKSEDSTGTARGRNPLRPLYLIVGREMLLPHPESRAALGEVLMPLRTYLQACIRVLRPDLDEDGRSRVAVGIQGQLLVPILCQGECLAKGHAAFTRSDFEPLVTGIVMACLKSWSLRMKEAPPTSHSKEGGLGPGPRAGHGRGPAPSLDLPVDPFPV